MVTKNGEPMLYNGANVSECSFADGVIIGEDTYAKNCIFGRNVHINRRNFVRDSEFGNYTYTQQNTTVRHATIGKFCSISWNVTIGGTGHDYKRLSTHPFVKYSNFGLCNAGGRVPSLKILP